MHTHMTFLKKNGFRIVLIGFDACDRLWARNVSLPNKALIVSSVLVCNISDFIPGSEFEFQRQDDPKTTHLW